MASTKNKLALVALLIVAFQTISIAQTTNDWGWNWKDSSVVPTNKKAQYYEFLNNQYPYPPKPRNQWELGVGVGLGYVIGDRAILSSGYNGGIAGTISARKAIDHFFSVRGSYTGSVISIPSGSNAAAPTVWAKNYTHALGVDVIYSLNTASNYRGNPKSNVYVLGGYSLVATKVMTNQGGSLHTYYYPTDNLIGTSGGATVNGRHGWAWMHAYNVGFGAAFKINNKINIGVEQKFIIPLFGNDYLDGNSVGNSNDLYSYSTLRLNFNL